MAKSLRGNMAGLDEVLANLRAIGPAVEKEVGPAIYAAADMVRAEAAHSITAGSVSGKGHVPSKPGEPPNADTRQLDLSIITQQVAPLTAAVIANSPHATALEFGTKDGKLAERPYMRPALKKKMPAGVELVRRAGERAIKRMERGKNG